MTDKYQTYDDATRIYILPNLFTAGNLFFGFLAIIRCIQAKYNVDEAVSVSYYTQAVWFILFACICDVLDGFIARMKGKESLFGKEFDSIADAVSFGMAPALMVFFLILSPTDDYPFFRQVGWIIGYLYLLCAGIRLARFNVITHPLLPEPEGTDDEGLNPSDFVGLPTTAAAGLIASLVLALNSFDLREWTLLLPVLMIFVAWLMVSNIPFPSIKNINWKTKANLPTFIFVVLLIVIGLHFKELSFVIFFLSYIGYSLFRAIRISRKRRAAAIIHSDN
ncbi:MAG: CDP-diacylglycerol--serine O-phosphatidyltransferase [Verrucomicrobia bacterium GWF2_51_19]|nr:MAG: CDP-diacylglycerol--serine O-phosphatidyltransferase [Verrucomicrobia bacterium GWF2_51_19]HCJ12163.1 CDP-diacylglycerol--serine O-phosphatidyltransferase [Opitutae bacterium]